MASDILEIYNLTLVRLGENRLATITDDSEPRRKLDAIYDNVLEQVTVAGPLKGWKFAKTKLPVSIDSTDISVFANYSGTIAGTVVVVCTADHNLVTGDLVIINGTTSYDDEYQITVIDDTNFYVTATFVAVEALTGDVYWTSNDYAYRYAIPSAAKRVVKADVLGIELTDWITRGEWILTNLEDEKIWVEYVQSITTTTLFPPYFTKVLVLSLAVELSYNLIQSSTHSERLLIELQDIILPKAIALDESKKYVKEFDESWIEAGRS